jgi:hypothetical protein
MKKIKVYIIIALIIFLITIVTSTSVAEYIENKDKDRGDLEYLGNVLMVGRISDLKFIGGYTGSYKFNIKRVFTYGDQEPEVQWIENRVGWVCNRDFFGRLGRFFIFAKGDFYLID